MLISHRKKFIYTKTVKTAGTSVESYFERFCMPEGAWKFAHLRDAQVSAQGVVGHRGADAASQAWRNHMPAVEIRNRVGNAIWDDYFKFCVIRNPFDKLVSGFFFYEGHDPDPGFGRWPGKLSRRLRAMSGAENRANAGRAIERFRSWVASGASIIDRDKYLIDGEVCVDYFIRYEDLENGVRHVADRIGVPFGPERIPRLKSGVRDEAIPLGAFYDEATIRIVERLYAFELERFGYQAPDPKTPHGHGPRRRGRAFRRPSRRRHSLMH